MNPQRSGAQPTTSQPDPLGARFTIEEKALLSRLRARVESHPNPLDLVDIELRRLEFVCWLVQHGKLSEE